MSASQFVDSLYQRFPGRVPVAVAGDIRVGNVYPFVHESEGIGPDGLLAFFAQNDPDSGELVKVAHLSTLGPDVSAERLRQWISDEAASAGIRLEFWRDSAYRAPQAWAGDARPGPSFVHHLQQLYPWRVPISVGLTIPGGHLLPSMIRDSGGRAVGLVGCGWNENAEPELVQVYHVSTFHKRRGHGTYVLDRLRALADSLRTRLYVQAQPLFDDGDDEFSEDALVRWYCGFGFAGPGSCLTRPLGSRLGR